MMHRTFACTSCQNQWKVPFGTGRQQSCPKCGKTKIHRLPEELGCGCRTDRGGFRSGVRP